MNDEVRNRLIEFLPRLRRFAYALTGDLDLGDDLVQETCARALLKIDQWKQGTSLESWIFRIAQNIWVDRMRHEKVQGEYASLDAIPDPVGVDGRSVTENWLTLQKVSKSIRELPENQQVLIALVCIDGASYKEAAEILEVPVGTIMSRLARARQTLYQAINDNVPQPAALKPESKHE